MIVGNKLLEWDTYEIAKHHAEYLRETQPELTEDEAFAAACEDPDIQQIEWEYLLERLDEIIEERNPRNVWYVEGMHMGWRSQSGWLLIEVESAKELLQKILPKTDCTFKVYPYDDHGLAINNAHHDSPVWKEWYYLVPGLSEGLIQNALDEATDAALLVDPDLVRFDIDERWDFVPVKTDPSVRWDWYKGKLTFLESDEDEKVSKAALVVGGMAFRECIARANVDAEIDLSPLWAGTIRERTEAATSILDVWLSVNGPVRADFEESMIHESIAILQSIAEDSKEESQCLK